MSSPTHDALKALLDPGADRPRRDAMESVARELMEGRADPLHVAGLLVALRVRGESADDLTAFARVMRDLAVRVAPAPGPPPIDLCGTGGDGHNTFNISTAAALVVAAAGIPVAKHGNRAISSRCGSADVLEALGIDIALPPDHVAHCLREIGIAFLFAPNHHAAMRHVMPVRRGLGVRTIFNLLGPLTNPAGVRHQLIGVGDPLAFELYPAVLRELGAERVLVVRGEGGMDEITPFGATHCRELGDGRIHDYTITPETLGLEAANPDDLRAGGSAAENARLIEEVVAGRDTSGRRAAVAWNAGAALYVAGVETTIAAGIARAEGLIASGAGADLLRVWRDLCSRRA